ncbi:Craniofacial development protein 2 [Eumeta japonica]|uniref:Craniofacial development protein 2 n=1 Tax=Eumeta variegata TaxID=151549 RepID=A0A4C1VS14_EUMVA|nr:Craniofacial development protein 2 [Eumeta japonica]
MSDFNAQVGARLNQNEYVLGAFGHGKRSRNGQRLVEFRMEHNLKVLNSLFKKKPKNQWTWMSPDGSYKNEIDYIITNHPKGLTDTNIITKLNFNTNHRAVRSSFKKAPEKLPRKHIRVNVHNELRIPYKQGETDYQGITKQINETTDQIQKYEILEKHLKNCCIVNNNQKTQKYQLSEQTLQLIEKST